MGSIRLMSFGAALTFLAACASSPRQSTGGEPSTSRSDTASATGSVANPPDTTTRDTTGMQTNTTGDTTSMNRDTTSSMQHDTTMMQHDTTMMHHDSTMGPYRDSTQRDTTTPPRP